MLNKIMIIGYYQLKDFFINIKECFEEYNYKVCSYPLFRYAYDSYDKISNYNEHLIKEIEVENPNIILWWFLDVPDDVFTQIKGKFPNIYYILYNNDETVNMSAELLKKAKIFDLIVSPTKENIIKYKVYSKVETILYNPAGFDPVFFYPFTDIIDYDCDISMYCNNLCLDIDYYNDQYINKIELIQNLVTYCKNNNKIFKLYGIYIIKEYFPEHYCGDITYIKFNEVYNKSRINICTHNFHNNSMYLNENVFSILGSGGLLLIDPVKDLSKILKNNEHCIYLDKCDYINQIDNILNNYEQYNEIKKEGYELSRNFTWKNWVSKIHIEYCKKKFDPNIYREIYDLETEDINELWNIWIENKYSQICYCINVPISFDYESYANNNYFINKSPIYCYVHWFLNSKNDIYITKKNNSVDFDTQKSNILVEDFFEIGTVFNEIKSYQYKDRGLDKLFKFTESRPYCDINNLLEKYLAMCD